jgi:flavorubredoxin
MKRNSSRRKMTSKISSIREKVEKLTSMVIGSPTSNRQAALPQVIKMMKILPPSSWIFLYHHHRRPPLYTYAYG